MINVREAAESDVDAIRDIFEACYSGHYAHPGFCETDSLKHAVFDDDVLMLVAEDDATGRVLGTAAVILDIGAFGDLMGEFGRLAVHPDGRRRGIGKLLMEGRLERLQDRLHIGIVENRAVHPFSQRISATHGFSPAGFLPSKMRFADREHIALYARTFGACLKLRKNHPRIVPEVYPLAALVMGGFKIADDVVIDEDTPPYVSNGAFDLEAMNSEGYASLLRFERGRVARREIIGPVKLHAGLFQLRVSHYRYLLAKSDGRLVGGVGFHISEADEAARVLELVSADDEPVRFLLEEAVRACVEEGRVKYIEVDVNAHAPAMQRTLVELGFIAAAYVPAMSFHRVERLDVIRMVKLLEPLDLEDVALHETIQPLAEIVGRSFREQEIIPRIASAAPATALFAGLSREQVNRLAATCEYRRFEGGEVMARKGDTDGCGFLVLSGEARVELGGEGGVIGSVGEGEVVGELSLMGGGAHAATIVAGGDLEAAVIRHDSLCRLVRARPDIGVTVYRNLASQLGTKLLRADRQLASRPPVP